ncbi:hypothetical protein CKO12_08590 [Chromatium okenii]|nr:hypothetical protein [Chromatium okenii]
MPIVALHKNTILLVYAAAQAGFAAVAVNKQFAAMQRARMRHPFRFSGCFDRLTTACAGV